VKAYLVLFVGVVSVSFAAIFIRLAEAPTANEIAGGLLILAGIFTVMRQIPKYLVMK
jgi:drug/metabolite transporter (DMT)-like permease